jgi:hypothetical protein
MSLTRETICLLANYALPSLFELDAASGNHQKMCESGDWLPRSTLPPQPLPRSQTTTQLWLFP